MHSPAVVQPELAGVPIEPHHTHFPDVSRAGGAGGVRILPRAGYGYATPSGLRHLLRHRVYQLRATAAPGAWARLIAQYDTEV